MKKVNGIFANTIVLGLLSSLLGGCMSHAIPEYSPSYGNINLLTKLAKHSKPINLRSFSSKQPKRTLTCRLEGTERLPGHVTFAQYLHNALKADLKNAGLYASKSKTKLNVNLDYIDFASNIGNGSWTIRATFNDHHQAPYTVSSVYRYSTNYVADIACTQVAQAFVPATQQFLKTLYKNDHFRRTLRGF